MKVAICMHKLFTPIVLSESETKLLPLLHQNLRVSPKIPRGQIGPKVNLRIVDDVIASDRARTP